ncbi:MAG: sulfite exporter TauE/SafE family protein [Candidatus Omnitrophica bacterium]|nr:sulfite exporter TauE/SafE family protein [Candidatus Omnitrophota bacterium]MBU1925914.1 sulfite exporter TauE/SafE family protein [Candidatus Omnitrophota bacterium]
MIELLLIFGTALWLGVLTSISPCPLATNIAAVSFLSKKINHPKAVFLAGLAYTAGRMSAYAVLGASIIASLVSVPFIANFLQKYMHRILGPVLIVAGLFLLNILRFNFSGLSISKERQELLAQSGLKGAFVLGVLFALAFCPISAALFFGSLIPLSLNNAYGVILPFIYGIGTGLPVLAFSLGIAFGISTLSHWFDKTAALEKYTRKITGIIFILVGAYFIWSQVNSFIRM